jgi:hypothetical protein
MDELVLYMRAMLLFQLADRVGATDIKPELLLARAGFRAKQIAELLGKSEAAVAKAISRAKDSAKIFGDASNE